MATEYESLRLSVSLVDNVSAQVEKMKGKLQELGGSQVTSGFERLKRQGDELTRGLKALGGGFESAATAALNFAKAGGLVTAGIVGLGVAMFKGISSLKEYATTLRQLNQMATQTGLRPEQIRGMTEAFERAGIVGARAQQNIAGLAGAMAQLSTANSELAQKLRAGVRTSNDRAAMEALLGDLGKVVNDPGAFADRVRRALDDVYRGVFEKTKSSTLAAARRAEMAQLFGAPELAAVSESFAKAIEAGGEGLEERIKQAERLLQSTTRISQAWTRVGDSIKGVLLEPVANYMADIAERTERVVATLQSFRMPDAPEWLRTIGTTLDRLDKIAGADPIGAAATAARSYVPTWLGGAAATQESAAATASRWSGLDRMGAATPPETPRKKGWWPWSRQTGGYVGADMLAMLHAGETVSTSGETRDEGNEGKRLIREQNRNMEELARNTEQTTQEMRDLVDELRLLNTALVGPGAARGGGGGGVRGFRMGGLGGLPGMAAPGAAPSSGFAGGGGTSGGGGATASWGGSGGGTTPSQSGGEDTGPAGDPGVPSAILDKAREVALTGGPGAVDKFMRDQRYPRSGAWCGQFAAAVVKSVGGTPPRNPETASNWRNWGTDVIGTPTAGDVAVKSRSRFGGGRVGTGQAGSHVTFVESINAQKGTFVGLGGNQGGAARRSTYRLADFDFRRGGEGGTISPMPGTAGTTIAGGGKSAAEAYLGRQMSGGEYDQLMRATHAESGARNSPEEQAMIMGSILNRAREHQGGISGALNAPNQFQAVTGTRYARGPSAQYRQGPSEARRGHIESSAASLLHRVPRSQRDFTAANPAAYGAGTNIGYLSRMQRTGGGVYGGTQFGTRLAAAERSEMDRDINREMTHRVEGTGKLSVDVRAPAGTSVSAEGGGLFKKVETNRQTQMMEAAEGPISV